MACGMGAVIVWLDGAAVVTSVNPLGPAGLSGEVLVGDHIAEVGGTAVTSVEQARALIVGPSDVPRGCCTCTVTVTPQSFAASLVCFFADIILTRLFQRGAKSC